MDDDDIRERLGATARGVQRSPHAAATPGTMRRVVRRHRIGLAARATTGAVALGLVVVALPLGSKPAGENRLTPATALPAPGTPSVVAVPTTEPPSATPDAPGGTAFPTKAPPAMTPTTTKAGTHTAPPATTAPPAKPRQECNELFEEDRKPNGVSVRIAAAPTEAPQDGRIRLRVTVRNDGPTPVTYTTSGYQYDFWATDERGVIWTWSHNRVFPDPLWTKHLAPGQEETATEEWTLVGCSEHGDQPVPVPPGRYTVRALWVSDADYSDRTQGAWYSDGVDVVVR